MLVEVFLRKTSYSHSEHVCQVRLGHLTVKTTTRLLFGSSKERPTEENRKFSLAGEPGSPRSVTASLGRPKPRSSMYLYQNKQRSFMHLGSDCASQEALSGGGISPHKDMSYSRSKKEE